MAVRYLNVAQGAGQSYPCGRYVVVNVGESLVSIWVDGEPMIIPQGSRVLIEASKTLLLNDTDDINVYPTGFSSYELPSLVGQIVKGTVAAPAAGVDPTGLSSANGGMIVHGFVGTLTCSVGAANRITKLQILDATPAVVWTGYPGRIAVASDVQVVSAGREFVPSALSYTGGGIVQIAIPGLLIPKGWSLKLTTDNIQVGDQWSGIDYLYTEV